MPIFNKKTKPILISTLILSILGGSIFYYLQKPKLTELEKQGEVGDFILNNDFAQKPIISIQPNENIYQLTDSLINGPTIQYANLTEEQKKEKENQPKNELNIELPKNYQEPINIKLDEQRIISITDKNGTDFKDKLITEEIPLINNEELRIKNDELINNEENPKDPSNRTVGQESDRTLKQTQSVSYLKYQSKDKRKSIYYAYHKYNQERTLKHWAIYDKPKKENKDQIEEKETYQISNAKIKLNDQGQVEVYYFGEQQVQNEQVKAEVDSDLMARAQRTLQRELGEDILNTENHTPNFIIPQPYYINKNQERKTLAWELNQETNEISINFKPNEDEYPIALDPTIQFTAPGQIDSSDSIFIEPTNSGMGYVMGSGDFNFDSQVDLAVGIYGFSNNIGRAYIFYNDGSIPTTATTADVIITGEGVNNYFGYSMTSGDFNHDGREDLAVGAYYYANYVGRAYIFYNDGAIPTSAATADVTITGEAFDNNFGFSMISGDFNYDGREDLVVGAFRYSSYTGRTYIFYNDGTIPTVADAADVIITGENTYDYFGYTMTSGDLNADGRIDLAVGAYYYSTSTGCVYIFYNDGTIPTTATIADVIITGETNYNYFGSAMTAGDFNTDGKVDLAVGARSYASNTGRTYIFYNDGTIPTTASAADVIITGESSSYFGYSMTSGDFNADGKTDLAVGAYGYTTSTGRAYIFYNDGSIPTTATTADVIITGEGVNNYFGYSMTSGDFNTDGRIDLAVGAYGYSVGGRAYIFYNDGTIPTSAAIADTMITGEAINNYLGNAMVFGDFNNNGKNDLVVSARNYLGSVGRIYIFYDEESSYGSVYNADAYITGEICSGCYFGMSLSSGDFNNDKKIDLVVSSPGYSSGSGRVYIFYNDGTYPDLAAGADIKINGESGSSFGGAMSVGDLNADGRNDLVVGSTEYSTARGRVYAFYNDGNIPSLASSADVKITGENVGDRITNYSKIVCSDINYDGKTDLIFSSTQNSSMKGRIYIFFNDGNYPTSATSADVKISGVNSFDQAGSQLTSFDFNNDGKLDLITNGGGNTLIFYNDGSYPSIISGTDAVIAISGSLGNSDLNGDGRDDLIISSGSVVNIFYNKETIPISSADADVVISDVSGFFVSGDLNADGKNDLIVAYNITKLFIIYFQKGQLGITNSLIGNGSSEFSQGFGSEMVSGDFNNDGKVDLAISSSQKKVFIFYNDDLMPNFSGMADVVISDLSTENSFGSSMTSGDFNADGITDLVVGARGYSSIDFIYLFYNDGSLPSLASQADVIIAGEAIDNYFGSSMTSGDFNADGRVDLVIGATGHNSNAGKTYIFYNDGSLPSLASQADVVIIGEAINNSFGSSMTSGDFNTDGRIDLVIGAVGHNSNTGKTYIFYNDGSIPTTAATADIKIIGEVSSGLFGASMASGDFNYDGITDLAVSADNCFSETGRAYIFYNDGSIPTTASTADVIIVGEGSYDEFGSELISGDFNGDNRIDLVVGDYKYPDDSRYGKIYIFYNDGSYPGIASDADVEIVGEELWDHFSYSISSGDFNSDGKIDLAVGANNYPGDLDIGRVYIFYNDGAYPAVASDAEFIASGDSYGDYLGFAMTSGDFNNDLLKDLIVSSYGNLGGKGKIYVFYNNNLFPNNIDSADIVITGESFENFFGYSLYSGDMNNDNQTDIIVGAKGYSNNKGRVYIIYNDGTYPSLAADSDIKIDGENSNDNFGYAITVGDIIGDSKTDLIIGANGYSTNTGRTYIFNNDGTIPTTASGADNIITGQNSGDYFSSSLITGDFDYDMDNDLIVGAYGYATNTGRAYIFNNDNNYPASAADSDIKIDGETVNNYFSSAFTKGDFNNDNRTDLVVGSYGFNGGTGRVYIFYNDSLYPNLSFNADAIISGDSKNYFARSLIVGDLNSDRKDDLIVGASLEDNKISGVYVFYNKDLFVSMASDSDVKIEGNNDIGYSFALEDFNNNNKNDLCVGYLGGGWQGGFYLYEVDAEGTKPDYVRSRGGATFRGTTKIR